MNPHGHPTRYGLLGPVEVQRGDTVLDLGPRQRRVLLVRLLIEGGRPVSVEQLCQDLWQGAQPTGAVSSVRAHISRLRSVLEPVRHGPSRLLANGPTGYVLKVPREALDTTCFEESVTRARAAMARGDLAVAREEIEAALGLWRGGTLGEAAGYAFAIRETARLDRARQDAEELRVSILTGEGDVARAIGAAEDLVVNAPLRETSWVLLMRALYKAGRPVEALRRFERYRSMLAAELGLDPGPGMRELHTAILRHDVAVLGDPRPPRAVASLSEGRAPARGRLVGRAEEVSRVNGLLKAAAAGHSGWAVVTGEQGSGKTRLLEEFSALAEENGFAVARASGGQALSERHGISLVCPLTQLLAALGQCAPEAPAAADPPVDQHLATLVRELTRRPTLCVIDDLDWAPPDFHGLLRRLAALLRDAPVAVVCALRHAEDPMASGLLAELARHGAIRLELEPLSVADVAAWLTAAGERVTSREAAALHRRSEGNPFTLKELVKLAPERRLGPGARVPAAVSSVVHARLAELSVPARTMLAYAAADGIRIDVELLAEVLGMAWDRLLPLVDYAVTARVLVREEGPGAAATGSYRFPELVREVVLGTLTPSSRQLLQTSLACALARRGDESPARLRTAGGRHTPERGR
ncbi:BREX system ATP-binding domain-containing protein [Streptomyces cucumeris]|uniref:BREX system ATP-binding domain-containing protein n=1 Tax=Streptomyces cucumeris TaxID=2962890 RepID=UPI003D7222B2